VCLYLETTNAATCCARPARPFEALEPPGDMGWELFTRIVDQFPDRSRRAAWRREPMMVPSCA